MFETVSSCRFFPVLAGALIAAPCMALGQTSATPNNPASVGAPAPEEGGIADIVVTATRTEQSQQRVPISVSTITGNDLSQKSIGNITDAAKSLPNVVATNGPQGPTDSNFFVRGVGQYDFIITNDPGVGVYLDGVYLGRTLGAQLDSLDLARIEVLRGPQGTLFGRNTIGGAVNIVTQKPSLTEFYGTAQVDIGYDSLHSEQASINIPISDTFAIHLSAIDRGEDGYAKRPSDGAEFGEVSTQGGRINGLWKPYDELTVEFEGDYTHNGGTQLPTFLAGAAPGLPVGIGPQQLNIIPLNILQYQYNPNNNGTTFNRANPDNRADTYGGSLTLTYSPGFATFKSITAVRGLSSFNTFNGGASPYDLYVQDTTADQRQFSQELQMYGTTWEDRIDYLVGAYYFHENAHQDQNLCLAQGPVDPFNTCAFWHQGNEQTTDSYAAFGQATVHLFDGVSAVAGGRLNFDDKHLVSTQYYNLGPFAPVIIPIVTGATADNEWRNFTPKLGLNWQITDKDLLYASWTRGFRSGGFNGRLAVPGERITPYAPDTNTQYEVGAKTQFLDDKVRLNVAGFYSTYRNIQLTVVDPILAFKVANAGEAEIYGFESELTVRPTPQWLFNGGVGYTFSQITQADAALAPNRVFDGNRLPFAPRWNGVVGVQYTFDLPGENGSLALRSDVTLQSAEFFSPSNQPLERQQGYALLNLRGTYTLPGGHYRIGGFVRNVTNRRYFSFGEDAVFNQGVAYKMLARGLDFGATLAADF